MKKCLSVLAAIVFCALGLASTSDAQMMRGGGPPQFAGVFNPKVGVGAAYEVQTQDGKKTMEMAIVEKKPSMARTPTGGKWPCPIKERAVKWFSRPFW